MFTHLYLHIPFCIQKCSYCSFFSAPASDDQIERYIALICHELELAVEKKPGFPLETIYFGGGTPSLLNHRQISRLMEAIHRNLSVSSDAEITLEANPGTVTKRGLKEFRAVGINRISLGVQSFNDLKLKAIGRIHTAAQAQEAFCAARSAGFENIGLDLMHGLPGQVLEEWEQELHHAIDLSPEHLSVYGLTIEEGTTFSDRYAPDSSELADEEISAQMFEVADEVLSRYGFDHYEIANYARSGFRSRHNCGYWKRDGYLGLGPGAHSYLRGAGDGIRFSNIPDLDRYASMLDKGILPRHEYHQLNQNDAMAEFMFLGLRMSDGILCQAFLKEFGVPVIATYGKEISKLTAAGLLCEKDDTLRLTRRGMLLSNPVFSSFLR